LPTLTFEGQLEVDTARGVIYFHDGRKGFTRLRICGLKIPKDFETADLIRVKDDPVMSFFESYTTTK